MRRSPLPLLSLLCMLGACAPAVHVRVPAGPQVQVLLSKSQVEPGHLLRLTATNVAPGAALQVTGWDQTAVLSPVPESPGEREGFLAVPLETPPGRVDLALSSPGPGGRPFLSLPVQILPRSYDPVVRLSIKGFERLPYAPESRTMARIRAQAGDHPGPRLAPWEWPVRGRISERFGVRRVYNDGAGSWRHGGYDIAAPGGTPVLAPADGRVLLTAPFEAHGNTILLDHGYGVITTYLHWSAILVETGDLVKRGQAIGEVGSTGGSTANHLHFQVNVNGRVVDPADLLRTERPL